MIPSSCGISIPINLTSPGAGGPLGTVAQEKTNRATPPNRTVTNTDLIITNLLSYRASPHFQVFVQHHHKKNRRPVSNDYF